MATATPTPARARRTTAGVVVIGNEVLSAKIADGNGPQILRRFADIGVRVGELSVLADDRDRIAEVVGAFAARFDLVVTTGGVGPTHDDCTWHAVGQAFGAPMRLHAELARKVAAHLGAPLTPEQERLALLPEGAELVPVEGRWPLVRMRNVYVLPGVPSLVERNLRQIATLVQAAGGARPGHLATAYFTVEEWHAVAHIDRVVADHPEVEIGSYPVFDAPDYKLRLTFEHDDRGQVRDAVEAMIGAVGAGQWVRTEWRAA
ncbi:MAG: competence/damage-inducible protein A [Deltaproteobacteria bacterium]|nr:competence/damage-inducible protein A [Deltaproteobacteria bacterium]